jgi:thiol-disulfide isomerase/thioredoxin
MKGFFSKKHMLMINMVLLLFIIIGIGYLYNRKSFEPFSTPEKLIYFYMNECGHCQRFNPIWSDFVKKYQGNVQLIKVERKQAKKELKVYKVEGFPTVVLVDDEGKHKTYNGPRNVNGLMKFVNNY